MENRERKIFLYALSISLLLHFLGLVIVNQSRLFSITIPEVAANKAAYAPMILEFEEPPQPQPEAEKQPPLPDKYFQIEENPNANEQTPDQSDILSEKSSISAAPLPSDRQQSSLNPFNPDLAKLKDSPAKPDAGSLEEEPGADMKDLSGAAALNRGVKPFSKNLLSNQPISAPGEVRKDTLSGQAFSLLKDFQGDLIGDVALSTYAWPWAPWLLAMKERFYRYLFVPPAYGMGLIEGYTEVWMKIDRNGNLLEHQLLKYEGHPSLKESTLNAFLASAPWKALPADFPDPYLELRVRVIYPNLKEYYQQLQDRQAQQKQQP